MAKPKKKLSLKQRASASLKKRANVHRAKALEYKRLVAPYRLQAREETFHGDIGKAIETDEKASTFDSAAKWHAKKLKRLQAARRLIAPGQGRKAKKKGF